VWMLSSCPLGTTPGLPVSTRRGSASFLWRRFHRRCARWRHSRRTPEISSFRRFRSTRKMRCFPFRQAFFRPATALKVRSLTRPSSPRKDQPNGPQKRSYVSRLLFPLSRTLCHGSGAALSDLPSGDALPAAAAPAAARAADGADGGGLDLDGRG